MKKFYFIYLSIHITQISVAVAQNFQLHYDFGTERQMFTSTIEQFKSNDNGSTFFFVDINYGSKASGIQKEISQVYFEIVKGLKFWDSSFELHAEYNGGIGQFKKNDGNREGFTINNAWLLGGHYTFNSELNNNTFTLQGMYKYIQDKHSMSFQITMIWNLQLVKDLLYFQGFADFWREDHEFIRSSDRIPSITHFVFLSEPQLWVQISKSLLVGGEVEVSNNFGGAKGFGINPTLALKWIVK